MQDNIKPYEKITYHTVESEILEPTLEEVKTIINNLKNNKSPGEDNINPESMKLAGEQIITEIRKLINNVWTREKNTNGLEYGNRLSNLQERNAGNSRQLSWNIVVRHKL